jgi:membrane protease YdiL (CAAX protease family)
MLSTPTSQVPAPDTPVARWQEQYRSQVREAEDRGDLSQQRRLRGFGTWPVVVLDTILLVVVELALNIPVILVAIVLFVVNGHHLGGGNSDTTDLQNWLGTPQFLAASALATQAAILLILQFRLVSRGLLSWAEIGFGPALRRNPGQAVLLGVGLGFAALVVSGLILAAMRAIGLDVSGQEESLKSVKNASLAAFIPFAITAAITAPLAEEAFFRGYALRGLSVRYGLPAGIVISSAVFGLLHLTGGVGWGVVALFAVGAILAWGYARTGNLLTNVTAHVLNNIVGLIALYHS